MMPVGVDWYSTFDGSCSAQFVCAAPMQVELTSTTCFATLQRVENLGIDASQIGPRRTCQTSNQVPSVFLGDLRRRALVSARRAIGIAAQIVLGRVHVGPIQRHQSCSKNSTRSHKY